MLHALTIDMHTIRAVQIANREDGTFTIDLRVPPRHALTVDSDVAVHAATKHGVRAHEREWRRITEWKYPFQSEPALRRTPVIRLRRRNGRLPENDPLSHSVAARIALQTARRHGRAGRVRVCVHDVTCTSWSALRWVTQ